MISFDDFRLRDGVPIYIQILTYLKRGVAAGAVADGDELPSRRVLSALLGVNPNTVQKAYRILEEEELICSHTGAKSFMCLSPEKTARIRRELLEGDALALVAAMKQMGVSKDEALGLIEETWQRGEEA